MIFLKSPTFIIYFLGGSYFTVSFFSQRLFFNKSMLITQLFFVQLPGHGDSNSRNVPTLVKDVSNVGKVVCGSSHTIAVSQDSRTVWSFGGGDNGKLAFHKNKNKKRYL